MFSLPAPLGAMVMRQPSPATRCSVHKGGGVVAGVHPLERVGGDALAQIALLVAAADPLIDGGLQVAVNVGVPAQLHKDAGHAGVLADGKIPVRCRAEGFSAKGPGFPWPGARARLASALSSAALHIGGQLGVGADAELLHRVDDGLGGNVTDAHTRATPLSRAAFATASATAPAMRGSKALGRMFLPRSAPRRGSARRWPWRRPSSWRG